MARHVHARVEVAIRSRRSDLGLVGAVEKPVLVPADETGHLRQTDLRPRRFTRRKSDVGRVALVGAELVVRDGRHVPEPVDDSAQHPVFHAGAVEYAVVFSEQVGVAVTIYVGNLEEADVAVHVGRQEFDELRIRHGAITDRSIEEHRQALMVLDGFAEAAIGVLTPPVLEQIDQAVGVVVENGAAQVSDGRRPVAMRVSRVQVWDGPVNAAESSRCPD